MIGKRTGSPADVHSEYSRTLRALRERVLAEKRRSAQQPAVPTPSPPVVDTAEDVRSRLLHRPDAHHSAADSTDHHDALATIVEAEDREARIAGVSSPFHVARDRLRTYVEAEQRLKLDEARSPPHQTGSTSRDRPVADDRRAAHDTATGNGRLSGPRGSSHESDSVQRRGNDETSTSRSRFAELLAETERCAAQLDGLEAENADLRHRARQREAELEATVAEREREVEAMKLQLSNIRDREADLQEQLSRQAQQIAPSRSGSADAQASATSRSDARKADEIEHLRKRLKQAEDRAAELENDAEERENLIRMQDEALGSAEKRAEAAAASAMELERRATEREARLHETLAAATAERDSTVKRAEVAEAALETAQASLKAVLVGASSPRRRDTAEESESSPAKGSEEAGNDGVEAATKALFADLDRLRERSGQLQSERTSLRVKLDAAALQIKALEERNLALDDEQTALHRQLQQSRDEVAMQQDMLVRQAQEADQVREELTGRAQVATDREAAAEARAADAEEALRLKSVQSTTLASEVAAKQRELDAAVEEHKQSQADLMTATRRAEELAQQKDSAVSRCEALEAELQGVKREADGEQGELDAAAKRLLALEEELAELRQTSRADGRRLRQELASGQREVERLSKESAQLAQSLADARKQRDIAVERCTMLKDAATQGQEASLAAARGQAHKLSTALAQREAEAARLREQVAVLEAANTATAAVVERQQQRIDGQPSSRSTGKAAEASTVRVRGFRRPLADADAGSLDAMSIDEDDAESRAIAEYGALRRHADARAPGAAKSHSATPTASTIGGASLVTSTAASLATSTATAPPLARPMTHPVASPPAARRPPHL